MQSKTAKSLDKAFQNVCLFKLVAPVIHKNIKSLTTMLCIKTNNEMNSLTDCY